MTELLLKKPLFFVDRQRRKTFPTDCKLGSFHYEIKNFTDSLQTSDYKGESNIELKTQRVKSFSENPCVFSGRLKETFP